MNLAGWNSGIGKNLEDVDIVRLRFDQSISMVRLQLTQLGYGSAGRQMYEASVVTDPDFNMMLNWFRQNQNIILSPPLNMGEMFELKQLLPELRKFGQNMQNVKGIDFNDPRIKTAFNEFLMIATLCMDKPIGNNSSS